eukprot:365053-Chlamydomonas_euryale.AAC.13
MSPKRLMPSTADKRWVGLGCLGVGLGQVGVLVDRKVKVTRPKIVPTYCSRGRIHTHVWKRVGVAQAHGQPAGCEEGASESQRYSVVPAPLPGQLLTHSVCSPDPF